MRRLALLLALLVAAPVFGAQRQLARVELPAAPLAAQLNAAIPTLKALDLRVQAVAANDDLVLPSVYRTARAEALLQRLQGAPAAAKPVEAAAPEAAKATIAQVNAALKDFTPEEIAKLPEDKLAAVARLVFDGTHVEGLAALSEQAAGRMLAQAGKPMTETLLNPGHNDSHPDDIDVRGVPKEVRLAPLPKDTVYRHYTTKEGYAEILKSGLLQNGFVSYVQLSRGTFKKLFRDVGGLFLTLPKVDGDAVGVPASAYPFYVDVVLPAALTVLEIEAGKIYMVPLPNRARGWVRDHYMKWAQTSEVNRTYDKAVVHMDADGGPGPDLAVPVSVVGRGGAK